MSFRQTLRGLCFVSLLVAGSTRLLVLAENGGAAEPNASTIASEAAVTVPLVGFRSLDPELLVMQEHQDVAALPADVFVAVVEGSAEVREALKKSGKNEGSAQVEDWVRAAQLVASSHRWFSLNERPRGSDDAEAVIAKVQSPVSGEPSVLDRNLLIGLTASELFSGTPDNKILVSNVHFKGKSFRGVRLDAKASSLLKSSYTAFGLHDMDDSAEWSKSVVHCSGSLGASPFMLRAVRFEVGQITFGKPVVYTASQKGLVVPSALGDKSQVFWLEFYVTVRNLERVSIEELRFEVGMSPPSAISLALMPDYDTKLGVLRVPGLGLEVGMQPPWSKGIKPSVRPGGLRENQIFWLLKSDAISVGSYVFTAIVQVPTDVEAVDISYSLAAETKGTWLVYGKRISTERPITMRVSLH